MLQHDEVSLHFTALDDIVPALTKIQLYIPCRRSLDQRVCVMPGMRTMSIMGATQERGEEMSGGIPAIKLSSLFDQRVNAPHKSMCTIHNRDFLMQRFGRMMEDTMRAIVKQASDAHSCQLIVCCLWSVVRE